MSIGSKTRNGLLCAWLALGCGDGGNDPVAGKPGDPNITSSADGTYNPADKPTVSGAGSKAASGVATRCGGPVTCNADVAAGHAHFAAARYADAFEAFQCANTPEAAFGAGMSKLLNALETKAADQIMQDLGQPHFAASALLGPDSYMSRSGERWNGGGTLTLTGARTIDVVFNTARASYDDEELAAETEQDGTRVSERIYLSQSMPLGVYPVTYACPGGNLSSAGVADLSIRLYEGDDEYDCQIPYSLPAGTCLPSGGNVTVIGAGSAVGDPVGFELNELRLDCTLYEQDDDGTGVAAPMVVTANGHLQATLSERVDLGDLHPIFNDNSWVQVVKDIPLAEFVEHAAPIADDLAQAGCFFDVAGAGSGTVFELPGASYAGDDLPVTAGDARVFAAFATSGAALLQLARAFPIAISMHELVCRLDSEGDQGAACPTSDEFVAHFNAAVAKVVVQKERLDATRFLVELALRQLDRGATALDAKSLFRRDAQSEEGWKLTQEFARAGVVSLLHGMTALPRITPQIGVDLRGFFSTPPDPRAINVPLIKTTEECETTDDCSSQTELDIEYAKMFFDDLHVDWDDGDYEFDDSVDDAPNALVEGLLSNLRAHNFMLGD
jgi:hypothetical protein